MLQMFLEASNPLTAQCVFHCFRIGHRILGIDQPASHPSWNVLCLQKVIRHLGIRGGVKSRMADIRRRDVGPFFSTLCTFLFCAEVKVLHATFV
jgi:hypothetical protein